MIHFLTQRFIENYDDYKNQKVRQAYGTLCSILSIICNIVLVIFKITIGLIVHSVAIQADGLNNLSDVGSNLASRPLHCFSSRSYLRMLAIIFA